MSDPWPKHKMIRDRYPALAAVLDSLDGGYAIDTDLEGRLLDMAEAIARGDVKVRFWIPGDGGSEDVLLVKQDAAEEPR